MKRWPGFSRRYERMSSRATRRLPTISIVDDREALGLLGLGGRDADDRAAAAAAAFERPGPASIAGALVPPSISSLPGPGRGGLEGAASARVGAAVGEDAAIRGRLRTPGPWLPVRPGVLTRSSGVGCLRLGEARREEVVTASSRPREQRDAVARVPKAGRTGMLRIAAIVGAGRAGRARSADRRWSKRAISSSGVGAVSMKKALDSVAQCGRHRSTALTRALLPCALGGAAFSLSHLAQRARGDARGATRVPR